MVETKIYETENGDIVAIVFEDGICKNYISDPEVVAMGEEGFLGEAKLGFPEAFSYEDDIAVGKSLEDMVELQEKEGILIAEIGEDVVIYPNRMGAYAKDLFKIDIGEEYWNEILEQTDGDNGINLNI